MKISGEFADHFFLETTMNPAEYAVERMALADLALEELVQEYAAALAEIERLKAELAKLKQCTP